MNSSRELNKVTSEKKALSSSCGSKKNEVNLGRVKLGLGSGKATSRGDHSNKSKVSGCGEQRKKISSNSNKKDFQEKKDKEQSGFKNIKKKIISGAGQEKENGKGIDQPKQPLNNTQTIKPKTSNTSTPRDQFNGFAGKSQKTETDEKPKSIKKQ